MCHATQQSEGKLDELLKDVAETSPGPDTPNEEYNDASSTESMATAMICVTYLYTMFCS